MNGMVRELYLGRWEVCEGQNEAGDVRLTP
jgi:hypothetical protein